MTKIEWINRAKGIGIVFVVLGHALRGLNNASLFVGDGFNVSDYVIYTFHMPLFFFLSGIFFLNSYKKRGVKEFVKNKISTLFYLYILWSIIQFAFQLTLNKYTNGQTEITDSLYLLFEPKGHMWFLYVLLLIFLINATFFYLIPSKAYKLCLLIIIPICIILRLFDVTEVVIVSKLFKNILFFEVGIIYSLFMKNIIISKKNMIAIFLVSLFCFMGMAVFNIDKGAVDYDRQIFPAALGILLFCSIAVLLKNRFLKYLGECSLEIYLAHILFASGTRIILDKFFGIESLFVHIILGTIMGVFGPLLVMKLCNTMRINFLFKNPLRF